MNVAVYPAVPMAVRRLFRKIYYILFVMHYLEAYEDKFSRLYNPTK